jgi:dihydroorotate dehydrogenase (NAD+) catalytic subunit
MATLKTKFLNMELESPTTTASGILGLTADSMKRVTEFGAGSVTTKSFNIEARKGHKGPSILPFKHGLINAVGLSNPGVEEMIKEIEKFKKISNRPIFASIFGRTIDEFGEVAEIVADAQPDLIEVNVSCPNVRSEFGEPFSSSYENTGKITALVKKKAGNIPVSIKLAPQGAHIGKMAMICKDNGADAVTAINTVGPGMLIDVNVRKPILSNKTGGVSGPAILPIAVKSIYEIYANADIPIIGVGGVNEAEDAIQLILAGASIVGIGSGIYYKGIELFDEVNRGIMKYLQKHGFNSIDEIRGAAHE